MAEILRNIRGAFILSINGNQEVRSIFTRLHSEEQRLNYSIAKGAGTGAVELIITNREIRTTLI